MDRINLYPVGGTTGFPNSYLLDSDLSGGLRYPTFEQLPAGSMLNAKIMGCNLNNTEDGTSIRIAVRSQFLT